MNILVAPNSMKGSLNTFDFADCVERGFRKISPVFHVRKVPIADGGDDTGPVLNRALGARTITVAVHDPLGRPITAEMGITRKVAIIEMAAASGLRLLDPAEYDPQRANTFGTGELIKRALEMKFRQIYLGVGGSATIDGGIGILSALGFRFFDGSGKELEPLPSNLSAITSLKYPVEILPEVSIVVLCDVNNSLLGDQGSVAVFGPQKGVTVQNASNLEQGLENWVSILERETGKSLRDRAGMGAAGGVAVGLVALLGARLERGAEFIMDLLGMDDHLDWADWVITGEGKTDSQGFLRKAPFVLLERARIKNLPVSAITGAFESEASSFFDGVFSLPTMPMSAEESMRDAALLAETAAAQLAAILLRSKNGLYESESLYKTILGEIGRGGLEEAQRKIEDIPETLSVHWVCKGLLFNKSQLWGDALNCYLKALALDPGNGSAQTGIELINNIINYTNRSMRDP